MQYLSKIKGVELELLSLLKGHDLDAESPGWVVAIGNSIEQVSNGIIWIGGSQAVCLIQGQILYSLISLTKHDMRHTYSMPKSFEVQQ